MYTHARIHFSIFLLLLLPCVVSANPQPKFKVGVIAPITGPVASMGEAFRQGFDLYQKENPSCASNSELIFEDGRYDGKITTTAFRKLTSVDKVDFTIVWGNTPASVISPLAERNKSPLLAVAFTPEAKGRSFVATFGPKTKKLAAKAAEEFRNWNLKRPAAIAVNLGNILEEIDYVKGFLGNNLEIQVVPTEEQDFRAILTQFRAKKVDGLLAFLLPDQAMNLAKQAAELHYTPPIIGADIFADSAFGNRAAKFLPRLAYVYSSVDPAFVERVKQDLGTDAYFFETASGYTLNQIICTLGQQKNKNEKFNVMDEIKAISLADSPIDGIKLVQDEEYGFHFESTARIYYLSGQPKS